MLCVYQALKSIGILISTMILNALAEICAPLSQQHYELHPIGLHRTGRSLIFSIITFYIWLLPHKFLPLEGDYSTLVYLLIKVLGGHIGNKTNVDYLGGNRLLYTCISSS